MHDQRIAVRRNSVLPVVLFAAVCALAVWALQGVYAWYGSLLLAYLGGKMLLSLWPQPRPRGATPNLRVAAIVTVYNEDPATLAACLRSIRAQTRQPVALIVVDDASSDRRAFEVAHDAARMWGLDLPTLVLRHPVNLGKREALATGFRAVPDVDIYMCVDSDAVLAPDALRQGVRAYSDPDVVAVSGVAVASNHRANVLTRLIDMRYINAFLGERVAYSRLGAVLCVTGVLAFWKASVVHAHLDEFLDQRFLGQRQTTGDDRHLTNLHQRHGRVVLARQAVAATVVPERFGHYVRQQARWGRSFWRESIWALRNLSPRTPAWWLSLVEVTATTAFTAGLLLALVLDPLLTGTWHLETYLMWVCIGAWARAVHTFAVQRPGWWVSDALIGFALAPLFGLMGLLVMLPLRLWSLATLRRTAWGTRATIEVGEESEVRSETLTFPLTDQLPLPRPEPVTATVS